MLIMEDVKIQLTWEDVMGLGYLVSNDYKLPFESPIRLSSSNTLIDNE